MLVSFFIPFLLHFKYDFNIWIFLPYLTLPIAISLVKMIYAEIGDNEVKWTDYSLELLQVKLELSDMVLFSVTEELIILLDNN